MLTDGSQVYQGGHCLMYTNVESLCCIRETNTVCQLHFDKSKTKLKVWMKIPKTKIQW